MSTIAAARAAAHAAYDAIAAARTAHDAYPER